MKLTIIHQPNEEEQFRFAATKNDTMILKYGKTEQEAVDNFLQAYLQAYHAAQKNVYVIEVAETWQEHKETCRCKECVENFTDVSDQERHNGEGR